MKKHVLTFLIFASFKNSNSGLLNLFARLNTPLYNSSAYLNMPWDPNNNTSELPEYLDQGYGQSVRISYVNKAQIAMVGVAGISAAAYIFNPDLSKKIFKTGLLAHFVLSTRPALDSYLRKTISTTSYNKYGSLIIPTTLTLSILGGSWALFSK